MTWIEVKPNDRLHMLIWRVRGDDMPWRVSPAKNGVPVGFGRRFDTWLDAYNYARGEVAS